MTSEDKTFNLTAEQVEDIELLRAAAKKAKRCLLPHVITDDQWVATNTENLRGVLYRGERFYPLIENIGEVIREFLPSKDESLKFLDEIFLPKDGSKTKFGQAKERTLMKVAMARHYISRHNTNMPDARMDGNIFFWQEHAIHAALWSPNVVETVIAMFTAQADAMENGTIPDITSEMRVLAQSIVDKEVWKDKPFLIADKPTILGDLRNVKSSLRRRLGKDRGYVNTPEENAKRERDLKRRNNVIKRINVEEKFPSDYDSFVLSVVRGAYDLDDKKAIAYCHSVIADAHKYYTQKAPRRHYYIKSWEAKEKVAQIFLEYLESLISEESDKNNS